MDRRHFSGIGRCATAAALSLCLCAAMGAPVAAADTSSETENTYTITFELKKSDNTTETKTFEIAAGETYGADADDAVSVRDTFFYEGVDYDLVSGQETEGTAEGDLTFTYREHRDEGFVYVLNCVDENGTTLRTVQTEIPADGSATVQVPSELTSGDRVYRTSEKDFEVRYDDSESGRTIVYTADSTAQQEGSYTVEVRYVDESEQILQTRTFLVKNRDVYFYAPTTFALTGDGVTTYYTASGAEDTMIVHAKDDAARNYTIHYREIESTAESSDSDEESGESAADSSDEADSGQAVSDSSDEAESDQTVSDSSDEAESGQTVSDSTDEADSGQTVSDNTDDSESGKTISDSGTTEADSSASADAGTEGEDSEAGNASTADSSQTASGKWFIMQYDSSTNKCIGVVTREIGADGTASFDPMTEDTIEGYQVNKAFQKTITFRAGSGSRVTYVYYDPDGYSNSSDLPDRTISIRYVDIATGSVLETKSVSAVSTHDTHIDFPASFDLNGIHYLRVDGQVAGVDHNYFSPKQIYTVYYRDANNTDFENVVIRTSEIIETEVISGTTTYQVAPGVTRVLATDTSTGQSSIIATEDASGEQIQDSGTGADSGTDSADVSIDGVQADEIQTPQGNIDLSKKNGSAHQGMPAAMIIRIVAIAAAAVFLICLLVRRKRNSIGR